MLKSSFIDKLHLLLGGTIIIFFLGDLLRKVSMYNQHDFIRYTALSKFLVLLIYVVFFSFNINNYFKNNASKNILFFLLALILFFLFGQFFLNDYDGFNNISEKNILVFLRYLFWPITFLIFIPLLTSNNYDGKYLKIIESLFLFNCAVILLAVLFEISFLKTYVSPIRFGYMGFYNSHNQCSYAFILFILYYYSLRENKKNLYRLLFVICVSLFIGTKKIFFFLMLLFIYHVIKNKLWKSLKFYGVIIFISLCLSIFFKLIFRTIIKKFKLIIDVYDNHGLITALVSYRDKLLQYTLQHTIVENWTLPNFIFGGPRFHDSRVEFGAIDLYLFFGILGFIFFRFLFNKLYFLSNKSSNYLFLILISLVVEFLAGGFLSDANQPLIFFLISYFFINCKFKTSYS